MSFGWLVYCTIPLFWVGAVSVTVMINSLRPSDTIWRQRTVSTFAQVVACCLTAPSHYLTQCWLMTVRFSGNHLRAISQEIHLPSINKIQLKNNFLKFNWNLPGVNDLSMVFNLNQWLALEDSKCWIILRLYLICDQLQSYFLEWSHIYHQTSNTRHTKSQHLNFSRVVLGLSLPYPVKPTIEARMKM